ncbi:TRAP transporter substrate-binding protein DctP [Ornithinicoccus hortensis]|uniref:TRAP-type C4-dicarboxylate transport system substrate-binding protein n=1 Tax=Ornithinicoccus hortensis TaxID=82346 RepID=A0A542YVA4_9MICO|nr:TRAP transporter substrate-binding protein DctP [Ornithinicoccus hortensis]TQL52003.1 TRAP-type C4-dicarboxylate transport system substrate-binding protein [Ornithinicoccus hortensis]
MRNPISPLVALALGSSLVLAACGGGGGDDSGSTAGGDCEDVTLRLSHQWPEATGEDGDFRSLIAQKFAEGVEEETDGQVKVQVFPNSTLSKSTEQYDAMMNGSIDMSVFPLDYASGRVPEWSVTLMPGLVRNHAQAQSWEGSPIGDALVANMEENGAHLLTWVWNAGAIGSKTDPIVSPSDVEPGMTMRAAGSYVEFMLEDAGAGISSLPSNEIYTAMQTGVLDAAVTSTGSFASYNLQEQVKSFTSPTENTFWFMFEPLIISTGSYEKLCSDQQAAVDKVGADLQDYAYTASEEDDARVEKIFADAGVEVVQMDDAAFDEWLELAQKQWDAYAADVEGGAELLELAQEQHD